MAWEEAGYTVLGTSLAAKLSENLERGSGIKSIHLHKIFYEMKRGHIGLDSNTVLCVDGGSMVDTRLMDRVFRETALAVWPPKTFFR